MSHDLFPFLASPVASCSAPFHIIYTATVVSSNSQSVPPSVFWPLTSIALAFGILNSLILFSKRARPVVVANTGSLKNISQACPAPGVAPSQINEILRTIAKHDQHIKKLFDKYKIIDEILSPELLASLSEVNRTSSYSVQKVDALGGAELGVSASPRSLNDTGIIRTEATLSFDLAARVEDPKQIAPQEPAINKSEASKASMFSSAIETGDFSKIRDIAESELNITRESDDALTRRLPSHKTQLEDVSGGGSYYRISERNQTLLYPTSQSLKLFAKNQRVLGTFNYEPQAVSRPMIKKPAIIIRLIDGNWEVHEMGVIVIPE